MDHVSPVTRLLAKRKMMLNVQQSLDAQKTACLQREEMFKKREENLRKKDLELQESLVLFDKFLKENEYKRYRAEVKAAEEAEKRQKWEREIQLKEQQLAELQQRLAEKKALYKRYQPYVNYFTRVMESYNNASSDSAENILHRYATLEKTLDALTERHKQSNSTADTLRRGFQQRQLERQHDSLLMNNTIAKDSQLLDKLANNVADAHDAIQNSKKYVIDLRRKLARVTMSIDNIYQRCCKVILVPGETVCHIQHHLKKLPNVNESDLKESDGPIADAAALAAYLRAQLDVIQTYLHDFYAILADLKATEKTKTK